MGTTADKLNYLQATKTAIKNAIIAKGVSVGESATFRSYADLIGDIQGGGGDPTAVYPNAFCMTSGNMYINSDGVLDSTASRVSAKINTDYLTQTGETLHVFFRTGSDVSTTQSVAHSEYHCNLAIANGYFDTYNWATRTTTQFFAPEAETDYELTFKLNSDETIVVTLTKVADPTVTGTATVNRTSSSFSTYGFCLGRSSYNANETFLGKIPLSKCYVEDSNGNETWRGVSLNPITVPATLIEKTITENGTYNAEDDNADGYSSVIINVPQGEGSGPSFANVGYDIVGTPNIVNGIVTNSNLANHVESNMVLDFSKPFVLMTKFNFTSYEEQRPIVGDDYKLAVGLTSAGYLKLWLGTGSSWNIANAVTGQTTLSLNTDYWLRFEWSGTAYSLGRSTNKLAFNNEVRVNSSTAIANTKIYPGVFMVNDTLNLKGSADLNETYFISLDETKSWRAIADKSSNVNEVGNLTIDDDFIASGFASNTSYFTQPSGSYLEYGNNTSEVITAFTLNEYTSDSQAIVGVPVGSSQVNYLCVDSSHYLIQWNGNNNTASSQVFQPQLNTKYIVRHITDGTTSTGYVIADDGFTLKTLPPVTDSRYTQLYNGFATYNWAGKLLDFGISKNHPAQYLHGSIDLNLTGFMINNEITYKAVQ